MQPSSNIFGEYFLEVPGWILQLSSGKKYCNWFRPVVDFYKFGKYAGTEQELSAFPAPVKERKMIMTGSFKFIRHPIFIGILMGAVFPGLYFQ